MKPTSFSRLKILAPALLVLLVPILFINSLLESSLDRMHRSAELLMREQLMSLANNIRYYMTPKGYLKRVIHAAHKEALPLVTDEIINMKPDRDLTASDFSAEAPEKIKAALESKNVMPLLVTVHSLDFREDYHWIESRLRDSFTVTGEQEELVKSFGFQLYLLSGLLYRVLFNKVYEVPDIKYPNSWLDHSHEIWSFRYLSRFSSLYLEHDEIKEVFTDYFGQQLLYSYGFCGISETAAHGAYALIIPQSSLKAENIIKESIVFASEQSASLELTDAKKSEKGFQKSPTGISYTFTLPVELWNQFFFETRNSRATSDISHNNIHAIIRLSWPDFYLQMQKSVASVTSGTKLFFLFSLPSSVFFLLFGCPLKLRVKNKLCAILGLIFVLPAVGNMSLLFNAMNDSGKLLEIRLREKTVNTLRLARAFDEENRQKAMLSSYLIRNAFANSEDTDIASTIAPIASDEVMGKSFHAWTMSVAILNNNGKSYQYNGLNHPIIAPAMLTNTILHQIGNGIGSIKKTGAMHISRETFQMGVLQDYISPEIEEKNLTNEGVIQKELMNTADTSLNIPMVCQTRKGISLPVIQRLRLNDTIGNAYLSHLRNPVFRFFNQSDKYCDIELAARLRKSVIFDKEAWINRTNKYLRINGLFSSALQYRDSGHKTFKEENKILCDAWDFKTFAPVVFAATAESSQNIWDLWHISIWATFFLAYLFFLLLIINHYYSTLVMMPINIFHKGIEAIEKGQYGNTIKRFSSDEFDLITSAFNAMSLALKQKEMIKRFVPEKLMRDVEERNSVESAERNLTFLASDIRGFTTLSERHSPSEVVDMLNSYFTAMETAIKKHNGNINKYIGDAIEAVFVDPSPEKAGINACLAAISMQKALQELNQERKKNGLFTIENGVGIATGTAWYGTTGSKKGRKDFTVIGNITEKANRIEALTRNCKSHILVCSSTAEMVKNQIETKAFMEETYEVTAS